MGHGRDRPVDLMEADVIGRPGLRRRDAPPWQTRRAINAGAQRGRLRKQGGAGSGEGDVMPSERIRAGAQALGLGEQGDAIGIHSASVTQGRGSGNVAGRRRRRVPPAPREHRPRTAPAASRRPCCASRFVGRARGMLSWTTARTRAAVVLASLPHGCCSRTDPCRSRRTGARGSRRRRWSHGVRASKHALQIRLFSAVDAVYGSAAVCSEVLHAGK